MSQRPEHRIDATSTQRQSQVAELPALVVNPKKACSLLDIGNTRLYELVNKGELVSYNDGRSRKITVESIHAYIARRIAESSKAEEGRP